MIVDVAGWIEMKTPLTGLPGETELKLWLRTEDAQAFRSLPRLRRARPIMLELRTLYFDTPDFRLATHGIALRIRLAGTQWLQTLKAEGERKGGLSTRLEIETAIERPELDFSRFPKDTVDRLIPPEWRDGLAISYETRFTRTRWNLRTPDHSRVEVALDMGEIVAGQLTESLCEVELELKSGSARALPLLAKQFMQRVLLVPSDISKAARGSRLARGIPAAPVGASRPRLDADMPLCDAYARIMRSGLEHFQANLPGLLGEGESGETDPEYLHQTRVAGRRMRSLHRLFDPPCPGLGTAMVLLAKLARPLGEARDWDVFAMSTLPGLLADIPAPLHSRITSARAKARQQALTALSHPLTGQLLLELHDLLDAIAEQRGQTELGGSSKKMLGGLYSRAVQASKDFLGQTSSQRHGLRIKLKRLRYALDYLADAADVNRRRLKHFQILQDALGEMNDATTAIALLQQLNEDGVLDATLEATVNAMTAQLDKRIAKRLGEIDHELKIFRKQPLIG